MANSEPVVIASDQSAIPVSIASVPSHAVTNAGTFAVQVSSALPAGTNNIGDVDILSIVPGTGATNLGKQTDSAGGATDTGVAVLAIRDDALTTLTPVDGDYTRFRVGSTGRLWTSATIDTALPAGTNAIGSITNTSFAATQSGTWNINSITTMPTTPVTGTFWQATQPVSLASVPTHAVTLASTTVTGTVAVTDNAGSLTVDAPVATPVHVRLSDGAAAITTLPVSLASVPSHAVTNAGTFAVQVTSAPSTTVTGTVELGATSLAALENISVTVPGTVDLGTVSLTALETITVTSTTPANFQSKAYGAVTTAAPTYISGTDNSFSLTTSGALRVDSSATTQPVSGSVNATLSAETTKVIGTVNVAASQTIATTNTGTFAVQAAQSGTWNIGSITTLPTLANVTTVGTLSAITAGPAIGSGFYVRNTDGTNVAAVKAASTAAIATDPALVVAISPNNTLTVASHAVTNTGTFAVQAVLGAETTKVIGTVNIAAAQTLANVTTVATVTNLSQLGGVAINMGTGVRATGTQRVTIATDDIVQIKSVPDATATYAPTNATTTAYAASLIAKASAGTLYVITGYNSKTSAQFIQVHDSATLPADAAVPKVIFMVPASSNFSYDLGNYGRFFAAGITVCNSSTGPTKTIGAADCWIDVQFK